MIVCVLGMHKSGTTLVAETLHHSGVHMADVDPEEFAKLAAIEAFVKIAALIAEHPGFDQLDVGEIGIQHLHDSARSFAGKSGMSSEDTLVYDL